MKKLPKVSIITVTRNLLSDKRGELFKKMFDSVSNQTYPDIEHIIWDGASSDGSFEFIKNYTQTSTCKLFSEPDNGIDDAYNKALKHATGKYVFFMNDDDSYFAPTVLEECVKRMENEKADYCYATEEKFTRNGTFVSKDKPCLELFWHNVPYAHATLGVKRNVLKKLGNYNTDCGYGGDYDLMIRLILTDCKGIEIPITVSKYTLGGVSSQKEDQKIRYKTYYILAKRLEALYKQFYKDITEEQCLNIYFGASTNPNVFPPYFLQKLIRFMVDLNLKNFNYNQFINYVNSLAAHPIAQNKTVTKYFLFNFIPLFKIKNLGKLKKIYLFNFIPLLKIKEK